MQQGLESFSNVVDPVYYMDENPDARVADYQGPEYGDENEPSRREEVGINVADGAELPAAFRQSSH